jgi:rhodanese-related sulfurtransferase
LIGCHISPLPTASTHINPDPVRTRKLLLHAHEIRKLIGKVQQAGYTLMPLNLHFSKGRVKLEIGLAKGKKLHDKRASAERSRLAARKVPPDARQERMICARYQCRTAQPPASAALSERRGQAWREMFDFDEIIDARSPGEFAEDHLPGAISLPVLRRCRTRAVGTLHKQPPPSKRKKSARRWSRAISPNHLETLFQRQAARLPAVDLLLARRQPQRRDDHHPARGRLARGATGRRPQSVPPACHRRTAGSCRKASRFRVSSAAPPASARAVSCARCKPAARRCWTWKIWPRTWVRCLAPTRPPAAGAEMFESRVWFALQGFDPQRPVFVESESKKIGNLHTPEALLERMRAAPCINLQADLAVRVELLKQEYAHFLAIRRRLAEKLDCLLELQRQRAHRKLESPGAGAGAGTNWWPNC